MKKSVILLFLFALSTLSACSYDKNEVKDSPIYEGGELTIGVVGEAPTVREENIVFNNIELGDLHSANLFKEYSAVFIMKAYLTEAAKAPFAKIYKDAGIPFFFIESKKSYVPFIHEETDYEEFPDSESGDYATGLYQSGEQGTFWGYGLYNDTVNETNILDIYSRIFKTIDNIED
ncbi:hypothetical protein [Bacillus infantis]|uniref:hypothetical protein n=1 Tax=Bacillus infantis TaxID=324767 RepID=UPI003CE98EC2